MFYNNLKIRPKKYDKTLWGGIEVNDEYVDWVIYRNKNVILSR